MVLDGKTETGGRKTGYLKEADVFDQTSTLELCKKTKDRWGAETQRYTLCTINAKTNETACGGEATRHLFGKIFSFVMC